jgi:hypothetical protein
MSTARKRDLVLLAAHDHAVEVESQARAPLDAPRGRRRDHAAAQLGAGLQHHTLTDLHVLGQAREDRVAFLAARRRQPGLEAGREHRSRRISSGSGGFGLAAAACVATGTRSVVRFEASVGLRLTAGQAERRDQGPSLSQKHADLLKPSIPNRTSRS